MFVLTTLLGIPLNPAYLAHKKRRDLTINIFFMKKLTFNDFKNQSISTSRIRTISGGGATRLDGKYDDSTNEHDGTFSWHEAGANYQTCECSPGRYSTTCCDY